MPKEKIIQREIIEWLEWNKFLVIKINNVGIMKSDGHFIPPRQKGISDLIALKGGTFYAIEVKQEGKKPTIYQLDFLQSVKNKGGVAIVATSLDNLINQLK